MSGRNLSLKFGTMPAPHHCCASLKTRRAGQDIAAVANTLMNARDVAPELWLSPVIGSPQTLLAL
jgi:hypothetical protein